MFAVKRFHQYLFGRPFTITSDHKPLQHLLKESTAVPAMASARMQRWALLLSGYNYTINYKPGEAHANADSLSRLPLPDAPSQVPVPPETVLLMQGLDSSPVTSTQIKQWTAKDPKVLDFCFVEVTPRMRKKSSRTTSAGASCPSTKVVYYEAIESWYRQKVDSESLSYCMKAIREV